MNNNTEAVKNAQNPSYYITADYAVLFNDYPSLQKQYDEVRKALANNSVNAIEKLRSLIKEYSDEPMLYESLVEAYRMTDNSGLSEQTIKNNYQQFPHFLLVRCAYAMLCLKENRIIDAAKVIDYIFDIRALYPKRNTFHIIEIIAFQSFLTNYFCALKDYNRAMACIEVLYIIEKSIPTIAMLNSIVLMSIIEANLTRENTEKLFSRMVPENKQ